MPRYLTIESRNDKSITKTVIDDRYDLNFIEKSDFSENPDIIAVYCCSNNLKSIPILPPNLEELHITNNKITNIPFFPPTIKIINLANNLLEYLPPIPKNVRLLVLAGNPLKEMPIMSKKLFLKFKTWVNYTRIKNHIPHQYLKSRDSKLIEKEIIKYIGFNLSLTGLIETILDKFKKECYDCGSVYIDDDSELFPHSIVEDNLVFNFRLGRCSKCDFRKSLK